LRKVEELGFNCGIILVCIEERVVVSRKKIVFTGGGSAGHVTPNIAIINEVKNQWDIHYIGSETGIERDLIKKNGIQYYGISSGKLRRYVDFENIRDIFRVVKGYLEARKLLKKIKPSLVFSKGGFVTVPVVLAARTLNIPILIHESDITPGLTNKISKRFATKIFTSFEEAKKYFPEDRTIVTGSPIRREIRAGNAKKGRDYLGFNAELPILTVMGGSLGSKSVNEAIRNTLEILLRKYQIVHICGKNNVNEEMTMITGYSQFEYINEMLPDVLAATDIVVSRGGSNALFEFLALKKPMLIIPLRLNQSRGDQILNAHAFQQKGYSMTLMEENLNSETLVENIDTLYLNKMTFIANMRGSKRNEALRVLVDEINAF